MPEEKRVNSDDAMLARFQSFQCREGIAIDTGQFAIRVPTDAEAVSIDFKRIPRFLGLGDQLPLGPEQDIIKMNCGA